MKKKDKKQEETAVISSSKLKEEVEVLDGEAEKGEIIDVKAKKKEKRKKIFGEIGAFFALVIIIALVCFGGWYWYTHIYKDVNKESHQDTSTVNEYTIVTYDTTSNGHEVTVLNDMYIYEHYENKIVKIMDLDTKPLYEGEIEYTDISIGTDGSIYIAIDEFADTENVVEISKLENGEVKEVLRLYEPGVIYSPMFKYNDAGYVLYGYVGYSESYGEDDEVEDTSSTIYYLDGTKKELKTKARLMGDSFNVCGNRLDITFTDEKAIIMEQDDKYGLYDAASNKVMISATYQWLKPISGGKFIATKNGKDGVIDSNGKKYIPFDYEHIDARDGFFIVGKNKKIGLLDSKYKTIVEPKFDLNPLEDGSKEYYLNSNIATYSVDLVGDKYVIATNVFPTTVDYKINEAYVVSKDGKHETIEEYGVGGFYGTDIVYFMDKSKKVFTFYGINMEKKYTIDMSDYDFEEYSFSLVANTILESSSNTYYNLETGEKVDIIDDFVKEMGDLTIKYNYNKNKMIVSIKDEKDKEYDIKNFTPYGINYIDDNTGFYYNSDNLFVLVKKNV